MGRKCITARCDLRKGVLCKVSHGVMISKFFAASGKSAQRYIDDDSDFYVTSRPIRLGIWGNGKDFETCWCSTFPNRRTGLVNRGRKFSLQHFPLPPSH